MASPNNPKRPRILVLAPIPEPALDLLRNRIELVEAWRDPLGILRELDEAESIEIVFTIGNKPLSREMIECLPSLKYVCHYGVGHDQIDLAALRERKVLMTNTAGASASCVADLAITMLTACVRQVSRGDRFVRDGDWRSGARYNVTPPLSGRRIGIYGLGEIGRKIALRATAFEMAVGYHNRHPISDVGWQYFQSLLALAEWADDLVIAVKATDKTNRSVDAAVLTALGPHGYLINVARGVIVDEDALISALSSSAIAGAGIDTFDNEPAIRPEFLRFDNVILSPHTAAGTSRAMQETTEIFLANLERYLGGQEAQNLVF